MEDAELAQILSEGEKYFFSGDMRRAKECFEKISDADRNHVEALNNLGVIAFKERRSDAAVSYFQKAAELDPRHPDVALNMGKCLQSERKYKSAVGWYQKAFSLNSKDFEILNYMGDCHIKLEAIEKAKEAYLLSLEINPDQPIVRKVLSDLEGFLAGPESALPGIRPHIEGHEGKNAAEHHSQGRGND